MQLCLFKAHFGCYQFIQFFREEQDLVEHRLVRLAAGDNETLKNGKSKYKRNAERIRNLVANYNPADKLAFLRAIAHNIDL